MAAKRTMAASSAISHDHEHDYSALLVGVRSSFAKAATTFQKLFATDADGLNDLYLDSLPAERQVHNCHCCKRFIGTYGNLVGINEAGETVPVMWDTEGVPEFYHGAFSAMAEKVRKARVVSVFHAKEAAWGTPETGEWSHISVVPPAHFVHRERALTAWQVMAATKENFRTVATALSEFTAPMLDEALRLLKADTLARSEKFIGPAQWLRDLHNKPKGRKGENVLWRAIGSAPEGYCHPKASVIGPLLDDIAAGLPFAEIKKKFDAKMHPLLYQRPQAAPSAGNIAAAEALVAKLGIGPSLERRFARLDELQTIWTPAIPVAKETGGGVFGHIKPKDAGGAIRPVTLPTATMTWEKFLRTVLQTAEKIEMLVPGTGSFIAFTTAANAEAPPIHKWDREEERNPVAWYVYNGGSPAHQWGLHGGAYAKVTAISPAPNLWGSKPMPYLSDGVVIVLEGAMDSRTNSGNALFPETLREELHAARSTIEAFSKSAQIGGREEGSACGYSLQKANAACTLRVFSGGAHSDYRLDRWD